MSSDEVAEWLRRWTANPMCSARVGSNPILVVSETYIFSESSDFDLTDFDFSFKLLNFSIHFLMEIRNVSNFFQYLYFLVYFLGFEEKI